MNGEATRIKNGEPELPAKLPGPSLVAQPHGGALLSGGIPGHDGSSAGRPRSELRERLRGSFAQRVAVLEDIADNPDSTAAERIRAVDILGKYGLGAVTPVNSDLVRDNLEATIRAIRNLLPTANAKAVIDVLRTIWTT